MTSTADIGSTVGTSVFARFFRRLRISLSLRIKWAAFAMIRLLDPDRDTVAVPVETSTNLSDIDANRQAEFTTAAVINDENANVTEQALVFYLRGIVNDDRFVRWASSLFSGGVGGLTFDRAEKILDKALAKAAAAPDLDLRNEWKRAFLAHRQTTALNRRAYSTTNRLNPKAVFWPDPVDPNNRRSLYTELPFARQVPLVDKSTRIVSAGSCFAVEIAHALQRGGYNYLIKEQNKGKPGSYEFLGADDLPNASAAWGIIFNTPSFRQLVEKAFEVRTLPKILWTQEILGKLRYLDPFRENISFESPEAFEANYLEHVRATREAFLEMDVFIITLGLNEVWYFKADGSVFSRSPWRTAPSLVAYRRLTVRENVDDLVRMNEILRAHNPNVQIICTLSPVALHASFLGDHEHIVTANTHSKAVLRVAAEEFERRCSNVHYFPSFEAVTVSTEHPWAPDQRHVSPAAVNNVMSLFHQMFDR